MSSDSLQAACELAYAVARDEAESSFSVEPPSSMRSFLYVEDLPRRAISVAQQAIEADSEFRQRVANRATEESVGRAGHLWLTRPFGWAQEFERLTTEGEDAAYGDDDSVLSAPDPDPELEEVYNDLMSSPVEVVTAQSSDPTETDFSFDPGESFAPASPPIADAPMAEAAMASVSSIGPSDDSRASQPPSFESSSLGIAAVTDSADYEAPSERGFTSFGDSGDAVAVDDELDFEADALESELSSLRGLVDRLANEREGTAPGPSTPAPTPIEKASPLSVAMADTDTRALEVDLETANHELAIAKEDLDVARQEREEARRQHSEALKHQVELEKELASIRDVRVKIENESSEAQAAAISLEDKVKRLQGQLDDVDRERKVVRSQLDAMTAERNQAREDRIAIKAERDELMSQVVEVEEKSGGVDVGELSTRNKSLTTELETTARELARMEAQAESFEEQIKTTTATADGLRTDKVELTSRLGDAELALETTKTQLDALKGDSERLAAEVGTLRAERDSLQSQLSELQSSLSEVLDEQVETRFRNDTDRRTLNELRVERDVLLAKLNDLELADREYDTRINALVRERDDLVAARDDLINERGQLRGEAAASGAEKDQMLEKLRALEGKISPMETELLAERRQREELANRLLEFDVINERNNNELKRLTDERESLSAKLDELQVERVEAAEVRVESESLQSQLDEATRRYEDEAERSRQKQSELSDQLAAVESSKTTMEQQLAELRGELDAAKADSDDRGRELARLRLLEESVSESSGAEAESQAVISSLRLELEAVKAELEAKNTQIQTVAGSAAPGLADRTVDPSTTLVAAAPPIDLAPPAEVAPAADAGGSFDWPPPDREVETDAVAGVAAEVDDNIDLLGEAGLDQAAPVEEDDLDEVSALISQTVSGFNGDDASVDPTGLSTEVGADLDSTGIADAPGLHDTQHGMPSVPSAPPSLLDAAGDRSEGAALFDVPGGAVAESDGQADGRLPGRKRRQIDIPADILDDEVAVAQFVVSSPDVVLLVDGDSVAKLGWPSLPVAQQRDALVTYLADLSASSGAAPDVVFDGRIGDDQSLPASRAVRIRLSTPPTEPAAALDELVDAYPEQWPIALVTDDTDLASSAGDRGAAVLNNGQLLDLFIAE